MDTSKVTRVEVIDHRHKTRQSQLRGRVFGAGPDEEEPMKVDVSLQDDGLTLKVFLLSPSQRSIP